MKTKTFTIAFLCILLAGSVASQQARPSTNLEATLINTDPVPLQSGEDGDITFKIRNTGDTEAEVEVEILDQYPFRLKPDRQRTYDLGTVTPGQEYQISTEIIVAENASDGSHELPVRVTSGGVSRTRNVEVEVQGEDIDLNLANLKTTPPQLVPDREDAMMTVDVVNNGEKTAENVVLQLDLPEFFQQTSSFSTRQSLGNIADGETKSAEFMFDINETAPMGLVEVPAEMTYTAGDSTAEIQKEERFSVYINGKPQYQIVNVEEDLQTGATRELSITVRNIGEEESTSTRIRVLDSSDQPFGYTSSSQFIGTLQPGAEGTAVFEVDTDSDADAKDYLIDFEIRGVKDSEVFTDDKTVSVSVVQRAQGGSELPIIPIAVVAALVILLFVFRKRIKSLF